MFPPGNATRITRGTVELRRTRLALQEVIGAHARHAARHALWPKTPHYEFLADQIWRDKDRYVVSIGPRLLYSDSRYQRAYFGVTPEAALATGLPAYRPGGGFHAIAAAAGLAGPPIHVVMGNYRGDIPAREVVMDYYRRYEEHYDLKVVRPATVTRVYGYRLPGGTMRAPSVWTGGIVTRFD